jgi:LacI family transcriptional regulator
LIEQNEYVQHHAARHLRNGKSGLIDLVIMRLEGGYDLGIMRGVQDALSESGHRLVVFATNEDEATERLWLRKRKQPSKQQLWSGYTSSRLILMSMPK